MHTHPLLLDPDWKIRLGPTSFAIAEEVEAEVDQLWEQQKARLGEHLFAGEILRAESVSERELVGSLVSYRYALASYLDRKLAKKLQLRPVAVNGITWGGNVLLFGLRAPHVSTYAHFWELAPSGGVGQASWQEAILQEMEEEIGWSQERVEQLAPTLLIEDPATTAVEVGITIRVLPSDTPSPTAEYTAFRWVERENLHSFCAGHSVVPLSQKLLGL